MNVGILGNGPLVAAVAGRLINAHRVHVFPEALHRELGATHTILASTAAQLARSCEVVVICKASTTEMRELVLGSAGLRDGLSAGKIVIDQTPGDPEEARAVAAELHELGVAFIDAVVAQCEELPPRVVK